MTKSQNSSNHYIVIFYRIRGSLGSYLVLATNLGAVVTFTLGTFFNYNVTPIAGAVISATFVIWMTFLPETPLYLYSQNNIKAAQSSADFYNYDLSQKILNESKNETKSKGLTWSEICKKISFHSAKMTTY